MGVPAPEPAGQLIYESDFNDATQNPQAEEARSGLREQKNDPAFEHGFMRRGSITSGCRGQTRLTRC